MMTTQIDTLQACIDESRRIVFFGGAGVSTESGIPDFRSTDGLFKQAYSHPPEVILSRSFFDLHPDVFFRFYREKMLCLTAKPNPAHLKLAELEDAHRLRGIITQNIDGLHQAAGAKSVLELHGSVLSNHCLACGSFYSLEALIALIDGHDVPYCDCGGIIKPDVVLYEEALDSEVLQQAELAVRQADLLIIGGTSLQVYPAAGLVRLFGGKSLVLINRGTTPYDKHCDLLIQESIGSVMAQIEVIPLSVHDN